MSYNSYSSTLNLFNHIQQPFLNTFKLQPNFSQHTFKSYQHHLIHFNQFLQQQHLHFKTFQYT
ncbi:site-specific integrase, partial [Staphylococcus aureus]|uniref:site-specific integrase n=1 Tax=Staphylococcus aureus TaxID=1280 RepID=UPI00164275C1